MENVSAAANIPIFTAKTAHCTMQYFRFGTGKKTMVILPGLAIQSVMGSAQAVAEAYKDFAADYTVYLFDRRMDLPEDYPVREMAKDTAEVMKSLGLHDCCIFGASQGGMIALTIGIDYPELASKIALGSTSAHLKEAQYEMLEEWIRLAEEKDAVGLYLRFGEDIYPPAVFEQYRDVLAAAGGTVTDEDLRRFIILAKGMKGFDLTAELDRITCPVLAIGVFEDAVLDSDATMEIAEKLDVRSDFRLFMYIGYGHAAFDTAPDYRKRLKSFFG